MLNLDTHILVNALQGRLTLKERRKLMSDPDWSVSAIALWEMQKLHEIGRLNFGSDHPPLASAREKIQVIPVNQVVCRSLASLDFQSDPADELIAATSLAHQIPLLTRDTRILASRRVPFA